MKSKKCDGGREMLENQTQ